MQSDSIKNLWRDLNLQDEALVKCDRCKIVDKNFNMIGQYMYEY
mgnify:CR=1 FL=1